MKRWGILYWIQKNLKLKMNRMFENLPHPELLKKTLKKGGDFSELFFENSRKTTVVLEDKKIDKIVCGIQQGVGCRLIFGFDSAYGFTNDLSRQSLEELSRQVSEAGQGNLFDQSINLSNKKSPVHFPIQIEPAEIALEEKIKKVKEAEKLAYGLDSRIVQVRLNYSDLKRHVEISNSLGEYAVNPATLTTFSVSVTVQKEGELYRGYHSLGGHVGYELMSPEKMEETVRIAVQRALLNLSAARAAGGTMPVVISSEAGGTMVHEAVGHGLEADLAGEGLSVYEGKIGQKVASDKVTVVEDPTLPGKRGSYSFDDEGVPSQKAVLIEKGVLKNYLHSRLTAKKMGVNSNAHGRRESYEYRPIVRMANTMIVPGNDDPEEIIRSVEKGLFVKMMGGGQVNTVNGDFIFEVSEGYKIEHGQIGEPVRGATLTGNGPEILKTIDKVGNDLGFSIGTCGKDGQGVPVADAMPTVLIPEMVVGGVVG